MKRINNNFLLKKIFFHLSIPVYPVQLIQSANPIQFLNNLLRFLLPKANNRFLIFFNVKKLSNESTLLAIFYSEHLYKGDKNKPFLEFSGLENTDLNLNTKSIYKMSSNKNITSKQVPMA